MNSPGPAAVIPTGTGNRYYDGPGIYNGDTTHTKTVAGQQATSVGDSLTHGLYFGQAVFTPITVASSDMGVSVNRG